MENRFEFYKNLRKLKLFSTLIIMKSMVLTILVLLLISCSSKNVEAELNWMETGNATWEFEGDEIIGSLDSGSGFVISEQVHGNFLLDLEFKPDSTINSGVFIHCTGKDIGAETCFEFNIWDYHPNQDFRTGAVVMRAKPMAFVETVGKWNTYKIRCEGQHLQAWVNSELTADLKSENNVEGYIALQAAGSGTISFRNVNLSYLTESR